MTAAGIIATMRVLLDDLHLACGGRAATRDRRRREQRRAQAIRRRARCAASSLAPARSAQAKIGHDQIAVRERFRALPDRDDRLRRSASTARESPGRSRRPSGRPTSPRRSQRLAGAAGRPSDAGQGESVSAFIGRFNSPPACIGRRSAQCAAAVRRRDADRARADRRVARSSPSRRNRARTRARAPRAHPAAALRLHQQQ